MRRLGTLAWIILVAAWVEAGSPTGWHPVIIPTGSYRERLHSIPMEYRPGRPFHIVGNTVRWRHHQASKPGWNSPLMHVVLGTDDPRDFRLRRER